MVRFHGYNHTSFNLQALRHISDDLTNLLQSVPRKATVFLELGRDATPALDADFRWRMQTYGGLEYYPAVGVLKRQYDRFPTMDEVKRRKEAIEDSDLDSAIKRKLIPLDSLLYYFQYQELAKLSRDYEFDVVREVSTQATVRSVGQLVDTHEALQRKSLEEWQNGDPSHLVENWKRYTKMDLDVVFMRDRDIAETLKSRTRNLLKGEGGSIFILSGSAHEPLISMLQRKLGSNPAMSLQSSIFGSENDIYLKIISGLRNKQDVSDDLYAQEFFQRQLLQSILDRALESGGIAELAYGFEDISTELDTIATSVPLDEIEDICVRKEDLVDFLRHHPLSNRVRFLLS